MRVVDDAANHAEHDLHMLLCFTVSFSLIFTIILERTLFDLCPLEALYSLSQIVSGPFQSPGADTSKRNMA